MTIRAVDGSYSPTLCPAIQVHVGGDGDGEKRQLTPTPSIDVDEGGLCVVEVETEDGKKATISIESQGT